MNPPDPFSRRRIQLREQMRAVGMIGAIISRPEHLYYLTGCEASSTPTFLIISHADEILVAPQNIEELECNISLAGYDPSPIEGISKKQSVITETLKYAFDRLKLNNKEVGIEQTHLTHIYVKAALEKVHIQGDVCELIEHLRYIKDIDELNQLKYSQSLNDLAFEEVKRCLRPGIQEIELFQSIFDLITTHLGHPFQWQGALGAGVRSALEDPQPGSTIIQSGDLVLVDIYSKFRHYYGDSTRTFVVGSPMPRQLEIHKILEEALERGENYLKPGVRACEVDRAIRKVIEQAGFGPNFPYYSGHGLGLWQTERPWIIPGDTSELQPGCVITLEPGIYIPGFGGLRLENVYLVTDNEPVNLTRTQSSLIIT